MDSYSSEQPPGSCVLGFVAQIQAERALNNSLRQGFYWDCTNVSPAPPVSDVQLPTRPRAVSGWPHHEDEE